MRKSMRVVVGGAVVVVVLAGVYSLSGIASVTSPKVTTSGSRSGKQVGSKLSPTASSSAPPCGPRELTVTSGPMAPLGGFKVAISDILTNSVCVRALKVRLIEATWFDNIWTTTRGQPTYV